MCSTRPGGYDRAIETENPAVTFLYILMRDYIAPGIVEKIVQDSTQVEKVRFSNDFIAAYAVELDARLNLVDDETALEVGHEALYVARSRTDA